MPSRCRDRIEFLPDPAYKSVDIAFAQPIIRHPDSVRTCRSRPFSTQLWQVVAPVLARLLSSWNLRIEAHVASLQGEPASQYQIARRVQAWLRSRALLEQ